MSPDDKICYCYHVSLRKLQSFARRTAPKHASQMSECLGAGTGCGWCIPFLEKITEIARADNTHDEAFAVSPEEYARRRQAYRHSGQPKNTF